MPIIDFCEIPKPHEGGGMQDTFELFSRDFLKFLGYKILKDPNRGPDGGVDIIAEELRVGIAGETKVKWLVSCKHKAFSGSSVSPDDEQDIAGRLATHECRGFIGIYSTLASSGLANNVERLKSRFEIQILDREKLEEELLKDSRGVKLALRYFPKSMEVWKKESHKPEHFFWNYPRLECDHCGRDLLDPKPSGIIAVWETIKDNQNDARPRGIVDLYFSCKGSCDDSLRWNFRETYSQTIDGWEDIPDICIPTIYIKWIFSVFAAIREKRVQDKAFRKYQHFFSAIFPHISRVLSDDEKERIGSLRSIPAFLGGLGYEEE